MATPCPPADRVSVRIKNMYTDVPIYVYFLGHNIWPANTAPLDASSIWYLDSSSTDPGTTPITRVTDSSWRAGDVGKVYSKAADMAWKIDANGQRDFSLPPLIDARIWVCKNATIGFLFNVGSDMSLGLVQPSQVPNAGNPADQTKVWSFMEFYYIGNTNPANPSGPTPPAYLNLSYVDFVSDLPIRFSCTNANALTDLTAVGSGAAIDTQTFTGDNYTGDKSMKCMTIWGLKRNGYQMLKEALQSKQLGNGRTWADVLVQPFFNRILNCHNAHNLQGPNVTPSFPSDYLDKWIDYVWDYYDESKNRTLYLSHSGFKYSGCVVAAPKTMGGNALPTSVFGKCLQMTYIGTRADPPSSADLGGPWGTATVNKRVWLPKPNTQQTFKGKNTSDNNPNNIGPFECFALPPDLVAFNSQHPDDKVDTTKSIMQLLGLVLNASLIRGTTTLNPNQPDGLDGYTGPEYGDYGNTKYGDATNGQPIRDWYAQIMHYGTATTLNASTKDGVLQGGQGYAFPYDDVSAGTGNMAAVANKGFGTFDAHASAGVIQMEKMTHLLITINGADKPATTTQKLRRKALNMMTHRGQLLGPSKFKRDLDWSSASQDAQSPLQEEEDDDDDDVEEVVDDEDALRLDEAVHADMTAARPWSLLQDKKEPSVVVHEIDDDDEPLDVSRDLEKGHMSGQYGDQHASLNSTIPPCLQRLSRRMISKLRTSPFYVSHLRPLLCVLQTVLLSFLSLSMRAVLSRLFIFLLVTFLWLFGGGVGGGALQGLLLGAPATGGSGGAALSPEETQKRILETMAALNQTLGALQP